MTENILDMRDVSASYRNLKGVLKNVSLQIKHNEFFGLVGESGCGKTTLSRAILGLIPFEGRIKVNGISLSEKSRLDFTNEVQAVFQDPLAALNPHKTIGFSMAEPLAIHKIGTRAERKEMVAQMLEKVGLDASFASRYPSELSGGQRQRVCIGTSLMLKPKLIVADEAVSALDVSIGAQILNLFQKIHSEMELSLLFISHNINIVYYLCDRIAVMFKGRIVEQGTAEDVCNNPLHPYTRLLMSAVPDLDDDTSEKKTLVKYKSVGGDEEAACGFYKRCPFASDKCKRESALVNAAQNEENEHLVRCHEIARSF